MNEMGTVRLMLGAMKTRLSGQYPNRDARSIQFGEEWAEVMPGIMGRHSRLSTDRTTFTECRIDAGFHIRPHVHADHDELLFVLEGRLELTVVGMGTTIMTQGSFYRIPAGLGHEAVYMTDTSLILGFEPPLPPQKKLSVAA